MGVELGTEQEWHFEDQLDWGVLSNEGNAKLHRYIKDINHFYQSASELWEDDFSWEGFQWLVPDDNQNNVVVFLRRDKSGRELICAINFSPNTYDDYRFGCPQVKEYAEVFNSDAEIYGGTGAVNASPCKVEWVPSHGQESSVSIRIPPFGAVFLRGQGKLRAKPQPKKDKAAGDGETVKKKAPAKKAPAKKAAAPKTEVTAEEKAPVKTRTRKAAASKAQAAAPAPETVEAPAPKKRGRPAGKAAEAPAEKKAPSRGRKKTSSAAE